MPKVVITASAIADLARLRTFLHDKNEEAAAKAGLALAIAFDRLAISPELGRQVDGDFRLLVIPFGKYGYLVAYKIYEGRVYILSVRSGREKRFSTEPGL